LRHNLIDDGFYEVKYTKGVERIVARKRAMLGALCAISTLFYPVTVAKMAALTAPFLILLALLYRFLALRWVVLLSLLIPLCAGLLTIAWPRSVLSAQLYSILNFRLLAIPSISLDHYFAFFSDHPLTRFCQINVLKLFISCAYGAANNERAA
jgi:hypothetical protein